MADGRGTGSGPPADARLRATRASYDAIAAGYAEMFRAGLGADPWARATLSAFAEVVRGRVLDVGCGPGWVTAYLRDRGADVVGMDLSGAMLALARRECPDTGFAAGSLTALPVADGVLGGVAAWYSLIHVPLRAVPGALTELRRVLVPGGHLLLGFQVGDEPRHYAEAFGRQVDLTFHRLRPDRIAGALDRAGFEVTVRVDRAAAGDEPTPQSYLVARARTGGPLTPRRGP